MPSTLSPHSPVALEAAVLRTRGYFELGPPKTRLALCARYGLLDQRSRRQGLTGHWRFGVCEQLSGRRDDLGAANLHRQNIPDDRSGQRVGACRTERRQQRGDELQGLRDVSKDLRQACGERVSRCGDRLDVRLRGNRKLAACRRRRGGLEPRGFRRNRRCSRRFAVGTGASRCGFQRCRTSRNLIAMSSPGTSRERPARRRARERLILNERSLTSVHDERLEDPELQAPTPFLTGRGMVRRWLSTTASLHRISGVAHSSRLVRRCRLCFAGSPHGARRRATLWSRIVVPGSRGRGAGFGDDR